jgi:hypothetical protein
VGVLGPEEETQAVHLGVLRCDPDQEHPQAVAAMVGIDEDVAEPGECGPIGDPPAEPRLVSRKVEAP